jgi:hypothetical protein
MMGSAKDVDEARDDEQVPARGRPDDDTDAQRF